MVGSRLDLTVSYPERIKMNEADINQDAVLMHKTIEGIPVWIALGKGNHTDFPGITYFPIYMIQQDEKAAQIGVVELWTTDVDRYMNEDYMIDLDRIINPFLLYSFATANFISKYHLPVSDDEDSDDEDEQNKNKKDKERKKEDDDEDDDDKEDDEEQEEDDEEHEKNKQNKKQKVNEEDSYIPQLRQHLFTLRKGKSKKRLPMETSSMAKTIRAQYHEHETHAWIQSFMKNPYYKIVDNEGNGDCFFATIRDAFDSIGQETTITKLRGALADQMTEATFSTYQEFYTLFQQEIQNIRAESQKIAERNAELKQKNEQSFDMAEKIQWYQESQHLRAKNEELKGDMKVVKENMKDFQFMKQIKTLDDLKAFVQTNEFWADSYAVAAMERILNIKFIILSSQAYAEHAFDEVLLCRTEVDLAIQTIGTFTPEYYLIVDYSGSHYQLIGYKHHYLFSFDELPFDLKQMIVDKCMEKHSGIFQYIPEFKQMAEFGPDFGPLTGGGANNKNKDKKDKKDKKDNKKHKKDNYNANENTWLMEDLDDVKLLNLYDDNVILCFHRYSDASKKPGKGYGERIASCQVMSFLPLSKQPHWRQQLDDEWVQPFTLDNHQWASVEHVAQACLFKQDNPAFYLLFTLDSNTDIAKQVDMAKGAAGPSGKHNKVLLRPKTVHPDTHPLDIRQCRKRAREAKFLQHKDLQHILLQTNQAKLTHHVRGKPSALASDLILLRHVIANDTNDTNDTK